MDFMAGIALAASAANLYKAYTDSSADLVTTLNTGICGTVVTIFSLRNQGEPNLFFDVLKILGFTQIAFAYQRIVHQAYCFSPEAKQEYHFLCRYFPQHWDTPEIHSVNMPRFIKS